MTTNAELTFIMERLGADADEHDAQQVADLALALSAEQGDDEFDLIDWLSNRTYDWTLLWEAANGNAAALTEVRAEAGLPVLG